MVSSARDDTVINSLPSVSRAYFGLLAVASEELLLKVELFMAGVSANRLLVFDGSSVMVVSEVELEINTSLNSPQV